jgi:hypothetical protein
MSANGHERWPGFTGQICVRREDLPLGITTCMAIVKPCLAITESSCVRGQPSQSGVGRCGSHLAKAVWEDVAHSVSYLAVASLRRNTNRFFKTNNLPFMMRTSQEAVYVVARPSNKDSTDE